VNLGARAPLPQRRTAPGTICCDGFNVYCCIELCVTCNVFTLHTERFINVDSCQWQRRRSTPTPPLTSEAPTLSEHLAAEPNRQVQQQQRSCSHRQRCSVAGSRPQLVLGRCVCVSESRDHSEQATKRKDGLP